METGAKPVSGKDGTEKTGQKRRIAMENAFAVMKTITLPRAGARNSSRCLSASTDARFRVPRGKAVEVPEPVYEVLENARRQLEAARKLEDELAAG